MNCTVSPSHGTLLDFHTDNEEEQINSAYLNIDITAQSGLATIELVRFIEWKEARISSMAAIVSMYQFPCRFGRSVVKNSLLWQAIVRRGELKPGRF